MRQEEKGGESIPSISSRNGGWYLMEVSKNEAKV
jgi:hypothetical protein